MTHLPPSAGGDCRPGVFSLGRALNVIKGFGLVNDHRLPYSTFLQYVARENRVPIYSLEDQESPCICRRSNVRSVYSPRASYNNTMREIGVDLRLYGTAEDDVGYQLHNIYPIHHVPKTSITRARETGRIISDVGSIGQPTRANIGSVKKALLNNLPVAAVLPVYSGCWESDTIRMPERVDSLAESHAVILMGFNDSTQTFRLDNSWGEDWGDRGFADIPYDYAKQYSSELVAVAR